MSILIKGMEMPKACEWCSFISTFTTESGLGCRCEVEKFEFWDYSKRQENCPLVEIPTPNGDLVDRDDLIDEINRATFAERYDYNVAYNIVTDAETIIEAEVSEG